MRSKRIFDNAIDYEAFSDPLTGLAAMIFVQAADDLHALDGKTVLYKGGTLLQKWEIINFLRSDWAHELADLVRLDCRDLDAYERLVTYG